jgi:hypothetical protein
VSEASSVYPGGYKELKARHSDIWGKVSIYTHVCIHVCTRRGAISGNVHVNSYMYMHACMKKLSGHRRMCHTHAGHKHAHCVIHLQAPNMHVNIHAGDEKLRRHICIYVLAVDKIKLNVCMFSLKHLYFINIEHTYTF